MDREGVHIRPQSDRGTIAGSEYANHAGPADVAMNLAAKFGELPGDKLGRAMLLEAKLGVCVQVLPPGGHFAGKLMRSGICMVNSFYDRHTFSTPRA
jgi:hypothetical protein